MFLEIIRALAVAVFGFSAVIMFTIGLKLWKNRREFDCHFDGDYENIPVVDRKGQWRIVRRMTDAKARRFLR